MPIYVYEPTIYSEHEQVNDCCYFEVLQSISEKALTQCPTCKHSIHRAVTAFHVKETIFAKKSTELTESGGEANSSAAKNAAKLAARHMCGAGCRH